MTTLRERLQHILDSIAAIRTILAGRTIDDIAVDLAIKPAFERYLEIISEASRHLPPDLRTSHGPNIPWPKVAGLGNLLRHAYQHSNLEVLWSIYLYDLDPLEAAVGAMLLDLPKGEP